MTRLLVQSKSKRFRPKRRGFLVLFALTLLIVAGCGGREGEVSGTVSYRGKPLTSGIVSFFGPEDHIVGTASIDDGKYTIRKVPPGSVKITVTTLPVFQTAAGATPSSEDKHKPTVLESIDIPPKYGSPDQSGLTYEVKPGRQEHAIDLK